MATHLERGLMKIKLAFALVRLALILTGCDYVVASNQTNKKGQLVRPVLFSRDGLPLVGAVAEIRKQRV